MISTRQQTSTRKFMEETLPSAGNGNKYEEQTSEPVEPSKLLGMPIDVLYGVCRSLPCSYAP